MSEIVQAGSFDGILILVQSKGLRWRLSGAIIENRNNHRLVADLFV